MESRLIVGEGKTEKVFLDHLKSLYLARRGDLIVKVDQGKGGSPRELLRSAIRIADRAQYSRRYLVVDGDCCEVGFEEEARTEGFEAIVLDPCFEAMALRVLGCRRKKGEEWDRDSAKAKAKFRDLYLTGSDKMISRRLCGKIFPDEVIEERRGRVVVLERLVGVFTVERG